MKQITKQEMKKVLGSKDTVYVTMTPYPASFALKSIIPALKTTDKAFDRGMIPNSIDLADQGSLVACKIFRCEVEDVTYFLIEYKRNNYYCKSCNNNDVRHRTIIIQSEKGGKNE